MGGEARVPPQAVPGLQMPTGGEGTGSHAGPRTAATGGQDEGQLWEGVGLSPYTPAPRCAVLLWKWGERAL